METHSLNDILTERGLMDLLNLSDAQMEAMRAKGLPVIRINARLRLYNEASVAVWLKQFEEPPERQQRVRSEDLAGLDTISI